MDAAERESANRNRLLRYYGFKNRELSQLRRAYEAHRLILFGGWFGFYFFFLALHFGTGFELNPRVLGMQVFLAGVGVALAGFHLGRQAKRLVHHEVVLRRIEKLLGLHEPYSFLHHGSLTLEVEELKQLRRSISIHQWFFSGQSDQRPAFITLYYGSVVQLVFGLFWSGLYWRYAQDTPLEQILFISLIASLVIGGYVGYLALYRLEKGYQEFRKG